MQTGLLPTCHGIFSNHYDMLRMFETPKLPRDFSVTWSMSTTSHDKSQTSPKFPRDTCHGKFWGSWRNGIWARMD